jgi:hypothetical protein
MDTISPAPPFEMTEGSDVRRSINQEVTKPCRIDWRLTEFFKKKAPVNEDRGFAQQTTLFKQQDAIQS